MIKIRYFTRFMFLVILNAFITQAVAQQVVRGSVFDADTNEPIIGANIVVQGTQNGTTTDFDGAFEISINQGDVLQITYLGYEDQNVTYDGRGSLSVALSPGVMLDQVVLNAFGDRTEKKSLGYSVQKVDAEEIVNTGDNNLAGALQGKAAGLYVTRTSGGAGGGMDIILRGISSITPGANNQPLFIIDGIPVSNDTNYGNVLPSTGSNSPSNAEQFSFTNRIADINPNDIASVNVLKGPSATALYGLRASNGAIVIETKKGRSGKPTFNLRTTMGWDQVNKHPNYQSKYREGYSTDGKPRVLAIDDASPTGYIFAPGSIRGFHTWGPEYDPEEKDFRFFHPSKMLFRGGATRSIDFNASGGLKKYGYYASIQRVDNEGIVPNSFYRKTSLKLNNDFQVTDKFHVFASIGYANSNANLANGGDKSVMSSLSYWSPSININDYLLPNGKQKNYSQGFIDNPRYLAEKSNLNSKVGRIMGNLTLGYDFNSNWKLKYQLGIDHYKDKRYRFVPSDLDVGSQVGGWILHNDIYFTELNSNLYFNFTRDIGKNSNISLLAGNQVTKTDRTSKINRGEGLDVDDEYNFENTTNKFKDRDDANRRIVSVYGELRYSFKNFLFLGATGRNDWSSTLPKSNRSFFYPSFNLSFVPTSLTEMGPLNYWKVRGSWSKTGKDANPYIIGSYYDQPGNFPFGNIDGKIRDNSAGIETLKPEFTTAFEVGTEMGWVNNRINLEFTYYNQLSEDQIALVPTPFSSGFSAIWLNSGKIKNEGLELTLNTTPVKNDNFRWDLNFNWSRNRGKVLDMPEGIEEIVFARDGGSGIISKLEKGGSPGDLFGFKYNYDDNGNLLIGSNGLPSVNNADGARKYVGNALPKWLGTIGTSFKYKGFELSGLLEIKNGGLSIDTSMRNSIRNGTHAWTANRDYEKVFDGVTSTGEPNKTSVLIDRNYFRNGNAYNTASEELIQKTDWVRFRNIRLGYTFDSSNFGDGLLKGLSLSVTANNILLSTPYEGFDPEGSQYAAGSNTYGFTGLNIPSVSSIIFGANLNF